MKGCLLAYLGTVLMSVSVVVMTTVAGTGAGFALMLAVVGLLLGLTAASLSPVKEHKHRRTDLMQDTTVDVGAFAAQRAAADRRIRESGLGPERQ